MKHDVAGRLESLAEQAVFTHRKWVLVLFCLATIFLAYQATFVRPDIALEKMVPQKHSYIVNAHELLKEAGENGNPGGVDIRIAVAVEEGDIFNKEYIEALRELSDEISLMDGVDTGGLLSLWTPGLFWTVVTEDGFEGGPLIDSSKYDGSRAYIDQIRQNVYTSDYVGSYIANDFKSSMITMPVLMVDSKTREPLDFQDFSHAFEKVRDKYQTDNLRIHIIGDIKKFADLTDGFVQIAIFFAIAFFITAALLYYYSRCYKATIAPLACSAVAVAWQLGLLNLFGYGVGVFSVLVPFLIFAIGISHGVQIINGFAHESAKGEERLDAARITFRHLVKPGLLALISDGIGFATLLIINVGVIQDLAVAASVGVAVIILTNLILLPLVMSYVGVTRGCVEHAQYKKNEKSPLLHFATFTKGRPAQVSVLVALLAVGAGLYFSQGLKIGDLDKGAPELRPDSRYNIDSDYITSNFSTSTDEMLIFVTSPPEKAGGFKRLDLLNRFEWALQNTPGVQSVQSDASKVKFTRLGYNEGNLKFLSLTRNESSLGWYLSGGMYGGGGGPSMFIRVEMADHKEKTLQGVVAVVEQFAAENNDEDVTFSLGYGNGVYEAATNQVIGTAQYMMILCVYGVVSLMCLITFRSWRAALCVILPLMLTTVLCQALMALLGIGIKVGTLPVIALGVGIGVDYGIYIYSRLESCLQQGMSLHEAYQDTLMSTGKAVFFTGVTLAIGVGTWVFSPIKFQADMGILLTFMFLWNMVGALWLLPALARFLVKPVPPVVVPGTEGVATHSFRAA